MKRITVLILLLLLIVSLIGCGANTQSNSSDHVGEPPTLQESHESENVNTSQEYIEQENSTGSGLPYFDISFSAEDFLFAGYKVSDGDRYNDIYQAVSQELSRTPNYILESGWTYTPESEIFPDTFRIVYFSTNDKTAFGSTKYKINDLSWAYDTPHVEISIGMSMGDDRLPVSEAPFFVSPILCGMSCDDAVSTLGLEALITSLQNGELTEKDPMTLHNYCFESQYGKSSACYVVVEDLTKISVYTPTEKLDMSFESGVLVSFSYAMVYTENEF